MTKKQMNELEKHKINRKLDSKEKVVIKALIEKIQSLKNENKELWSEVNRLKTYIKVLIKQNKDIGENK